MTSASHYSDDARIWRMRAEEARAHANELKGFEPKAIMLRIAVEYDKLAEWAEKHSVTLAGQKTFE
jgi:hypothetical protein